MSAGEQAQQATTTTEAKQDALLDTIIQAMPKHTKEETGREWIQSFIDQATKGVVKWDKSVTVSIEGAINAIDEQLSKQLSAIMHHDAFQKLESSWRGLHYLVMHTETDKMLQLRVLNCPKDELLKDFETAADFDQSQFFKKVYTGEFDMWGAAPYGAIVGDYEFTNHPNDFKLLKHISKVSAAAHCPFLSAASPSLFDLGDFTQLPKPRDLEKTFLQKKYAPWESFRKSPDSRYVCLTMPRVLSRLPYGKSTNPIEEFEFEEVELGQDGKTNVKVPHDHFAWMNSAFAYGARVTESFKLTGWCTRIRGIEFGGVISDLPVYTFKTDDGDEQMQCPSECAISERRENELSKLGFLSLCHWRDKDFSAFIGGQTTQEPEKYVEAIDSENAQISARLPYVFAASRIAHYLKCIARDKIGNPEWSDRQSIQKWLKNWIAQYVMSDARSAKQKAEYPLREASISVEAIPGKSGAYKASCQLRPWLGLEELHAAVSMVAEIRSENKE